MKTTLEDCEEHQAHGWALLPQVEAIASARKVFLCLLALKNQSVLVEAMMGNTSYRERLYLQPVCGHQRTGLRMKCWVRLGTATIWVTSCKACRPVRSGKETCFLIVLYALCQARSGSTNWHSWLWDQNNNWTFFKMTPNLKARSFSNDEVG